MDTLPWRAHMFNVVEVPSPTRVEQETWLERVTPRWDASRRATFISKHVGASFAELEQALSRLESPLLEMSTHQLALCHELDALSEPGQELLMQHQELAQHVRELESRGVVHRRVANRWVFTAHALDAIERGTTQTSYALPGPLYSGLRAQADEPLVAFALFELAMQRADYHDALARISTHFEAWCVCGWLHIVWNHLSSSEQLPIAFECYQMRCALVTLDSSHLDVLCAPLDSAPSTQLIWMNVLAERGEIEQARHIFTAHRGALSESNAHLYEVSLDMGEGAFECAVERGERLDRAELDMAQSLFLDALIVLALTWLHRGEEAMASAEKLRVKLGGQTRKHPLHRHAWVNLARALHLCGELVLARHALVQVAAQPIHYDDLFLSFHSQSSVDYLEALLCVQALDLDQAERLLEPLAIRYLPANSLGFHVHQLLVAISLSRDDYEGVLARFEHIHHMHRQDHEPWNVLHVYRARAISEQQGFAHTTVLMTPEHSWIQAARFDLERTLRLDGLEQALQWGESPQERQDVLATSETLRSLFELCRSDEDESYYDAMIQNLMTRRAQAERGQDITSQVLLERHHALCALYRGRNDVLELWQGVEASARLYDNQVWQQAGAFVVAIHEVNQLSCEALIGMWAGLPLSMMRRVCEGILGAHLPDRVERRCAQMLATKLTWHGERVPVPQKMPELWLDLQRGVLCSAIGSASLPSRGAQRKLLEVLSNQPGQPHTKEQLLAKVWGIDAFHPLKHENRLRMAIFKLRKLVEHLSEEASTPHTFIVTRDDGYILSDSVSVVTYK